MTHALIEPEQTPPPAAPAAKDTRRRANALVTFLLVVAGVLILLYPVVATQYNNVKQTEFARQYNRDLQTFSTADLEADLAAARDYNSRLPGVPILDPWLVSAQEDPGSEAYRDYSAQLALTDVMARVTVPDVGIDLPVRHGTTDDVIEQGAGHLYGTSLPVGGEGMHSVITSHSGMPYATLFDNLTKVKEGQLVFVHVNNEVLAYKVDQIKVILPNELDDLTPVAGKDLLTLFTCTPYGVNTHRLLVRGERVEYTPEMAKKLEDEAIAFRMENWMWIFVAGAIIGLVGMLWVLRRERKRSRARKAQRAAANSAASSTEDELNNGGPDSESEK